jgi:hypothetical protein
MSMLAIVTFDLHGAKSKHYGQVKRKLRGLKLEKQINAKEKDYPTKLPANTFAAKFRGKWRKKNASELRDHLREEVCMAISSLGLHATVFVVIADTWAWGRRSIRPRKRSD